MGTGGSEERLAAGVGMGVGLVGPGGGVGGGRPGGGGQGGMLAGRVGRGWYKRCCNVWEESCHDTEKSSKMLES